MVLRLCNRTSFWPLQLRVAPSHRLVETKPWDKSSYLLTSLVRPFSNCENESGKRVSSTQLTSLTEEEDAAKVTRT